EAGCTAAADRISLISQIQNAWCSIEPFPPAHPAPFSHGQVSSKLVNFLFL
uniref:Si:ch211-151m7.6 n=1 Tax=Oryzias latipes TaxID=8090 RepID=A0A3B3HI04_ORYLA